MVFCCLLGWGNRLWAEAPTLVQYDVDKWTLHLWHLNESRAPFEDVVEGGLPLAGQLYGAQAGQTAADGMGACVSLTRDEKQGPFEAGTLGGMIHCAGKGANGPEDDAAESFRYCGADGAFTLEAIVRFDHLFADFPSEAGAIISMDGESANRVFNFRVEKKGYLAFIPMGRSVGGGMAIIPTVGPDAINTRDWFHVAVTYNGVQGAVNNVRLYWTRLDAPKSQANLLGYGTLMQDITGISDFALGNAARWPEGQEPLAGRMDEVRISSVERAATDFLFIPAAQRGISEEVGKDKISQLSIQMLGVNVDGKRVGSEALKNFTLSEGVENIDFHFLVPEGDKVPAQIRTRLQGWAEDWEACASGMSLTFEILNEQQEVVSRVRNMMNDTSPNWQASLEDSAMNARTEPLFVPGGSRWLRIVLSSGLEGNTGLCAIDGLSFLSRDATGKTVPYISSENFKILHETYTPQGAPKGWMRGGSSAIPRLAYPNGLAALALVDGDQQETGSWSILQEMPAVPTEGFTMVVQWKELYSVIGAARHEASYVKLPVGSYIFDAVAVGADGQMDAHVSIPFTVKPYFWKSSWFLSSMAALVMLLLGFGLFMLQRLRVSRRLGRLIMEKALVEDRSRIASDLHDDLGTRITLLTMNAALIEQNLKEIPPTARRHLDNLASSSRQLVSVMDDLVWAVDPANDTLFHLGLHLNRLAQDIFEDSGVVLKLDFPMDVEPRTVRSDFRHNILLAVKEALHNVLRHAAASNVCLSWNLLDGVFGITIKDDGQGFDPQSPQLGNGLGNFTKRMHGIGGRYELISSPGHGTTMHFYCPLPPYSHEK